MSAIKSELINYINDIPDYKLEPIAPLLKMLHDDVMLIEKVNFDDLMEDEKESLRQGREDYKNGSTISLDNISQ